MAEILKEHQKMICTGMAFGVVNDLQVKGKFNFLQNIRILKEGEISARPRLNTYLSFSRADTQEVPHSIKVIIDELSNSFNRIVGVGTEIWSGNGILLTQIDTGYSGKPLALFDFRPEQAISAYCYIGDANKFRKISINDEISDVGIDPPTLPLTWKLSAPNRKIVDEIDIGSDTDWDHLTGNASAPTLEDRLDTTIDIYVSDENSGPCYASIIPTTFTSDIQKGMILELNGADTIFVEEIIPAAIDTTIASIIYEIGTNGECTIVLAISSTNVVRNSILYLNSTEYVRVEDVTMDDKGIPSIKTTTVGTIAAGNTVLGKPSFRFYDTVGGYSNGDTIKAQSLKSVISASGISSLTRTFNIDLLSTASRALTMDDIFHISMQISDISKLTEIQIQFDIDETTNDFTKNYFYGVINPNFFLGSADQTTPTLSVIQQALQRTELIKQGVRQQNVFNHSNRGLPDYMSEITSNMAQWQGYGSDFGPVFDDTLPGGAIPQTALGSNQWTEIFLRLGDLKRVGSDNSKTLKDIKAIRISIVTTDALDIFFDSLWVGGADALDNSQGFLKYNYIWRLRNPTTGEPSNWSPPIRTGIKITRGTTELEFPTVITSNYPPEYVIDIARYGGTLNDFRILGTLSNDGSSYIDESSDGLIADNQLAGRKEGNTNAVFDYYKPFAFIDVPKRGTCDVNGTIFKWKTGDKLNTSYPRGTLITIKGKTNWFYTNPSSTGAANAAEKIELEKDMGALVDVEFECLEPLLTGQPLSTILGPFGEGNFGLFYFGLREGTLYWLDGNSPGTMSDLNSREITSPSEPLIAGVMYDGLPYVWTSRKSFQIIPSYDGEQFSFIGRENANSRGLFSQWAITAGRDYIYHLTENADGIVRIQGNGNPQYITEGISNLFYNNGKAPSVSQLVDGTEIFPPDFTLIEHLRFFAVRDYVFFRFRDTQGKDRCLVFDEKSNDWISYDVYINDKINGIYFEEKESSSVILAGIPDGVAQFSNTGIYEVLQLAKVVPFTFDGGDSETIKEFKEEVLSADEGTLGLTVRNYYNNGDSNDPFITIAGDVSHKRKRFINSLQDIDGIGVLARNITPIFEWLVTSEVKLYENTIYFLSQSDEIVDLSGDVEFSGDIGERLWQGIVIRANTYGEDKQLDFYNDQGELKASVIINCDGFKTIAKSFDQPFISHTIKRTSVDGITWIPDKEVYVFDPEPESAQVWEGEFNLSDLTGLIQMKRMGIAYRSNADATITLNFDDGTTQEYSLPNSSEDWHKEFFYLTSKKWKACKYRIEAEAGGKTRLYRKHSEVWMRSFNAQEGFQPMHPFGGDSNINDIKV